MSNTNQNDIDQRRLRWRLILGESSESLLGGLSEQWQDRETAIGFLYDRDQQGKNSRPGSSSGKKGGNTGQNGDRRGTLDPSNLTVPDWINAIHELFPKQTIERLEKDALERYNLAEMVTNPDLLRRAQPSETLLKAVLRTKHLMNQDVLTLAKDLVRKVVEQLLEKLARPVQTPFNGSLNRQRRSYLKIAKNFDATTTIRRNLRHYDRDRQQLLIQTPYFNSRLRRQVDRWQLIILVDESGSMMDSVIHSAQNPPLSVRHRRGRRDRGLCRSRGNLDESPTRRRHRHWPGPDLRPKPRRKSPPHDRYPDHGFLRRSPPRSLVCGDQRTRRKRRHPPRTRGPR
jgi:hypothetical protein